MENAAIHLERQLAYTDFFRAYRIFRDARIINHPEHLVRDRQCPRTTCPGLVIAEAGFRQPASLPW